MEIYREFLFFSIRCVIRSLVISSIIIVLINQ